MAWDAAVVLKFGPGEEYTSRYVARGARLVREQGQASADTEIASLSVGPADQGGLGEDGQDQRGVSYRFRRKRRRHPDTFEPEHSASAEQDQPTKYGALVSGGAPNASTSVRRVCFGGSI